MTIKDIACGHEDSTDYVMVDVGLHYLGEEEIHMDGDNALYLIDNEGDYTLIGSNCSDGDHDLQLFGDLGVVIPQQGKDYSGQVCFYNLETDNRDYRLVYNPNDGFTPNHIFLLPAE